MPRISKSSSTTSFPRSHISTHLTRTAAIFRPVPLARLRREIRSPVPGLFQLRRCQEDLLPSTAHPAASTARWACACARASWWWAPRSMPTKSPRGGVSAHRWPLARRRHRAFPRPAQRRNAVRGSRASAQAPGKGGGSAETARRPARDVDRLNGVANHAFLAPFAVEMWFMRDGNWQHPQSLWFRSARSSQFARPQLPRHSPSHTQKAGRARAPGVFGLLARWYYSSWRDGEWLSFDVTTTSLRKLVNAVSRVSHRSPAHEGR